MLVVGEDVKKFVEKEERLVVVDELEDAKESVSVRPLSTLESHCWDEDFWGK